MSQNYELPVLGSLLIGGLTPVAQRVLATVPVSAFRLAPHRTIYTEITKMARTQNLIDGYVVAEACGELFGYVMQVAKDTPSAANLDGYAERLLGEYRVRSCADLLRTMLPILEQGTLDQGTDAMQQLRDEIQALARAKTQIKPVRLADSLNAWAERLEERQANGLESDTLKTGIDDLDAITGGFNPEDLVIVAARPGMGKTEFALKVIRQVANRTLPNTATRRAVLMFTMEMSDQQVTERAVAQTGMISVSKLRNPAELDDDGWARIGAAITDLMDLDVYTVDASRLTVEEIRAIAEDLKTELPQLSLILVDYLGLIAKPQRERNDLAVAHISASLKAMAKELRTTTVALSQLSRAVESRQDKRPNNADLRDSGSVEQDADVIIMLYREAVYNEHSPAAPYGEIIVTKNRFGSLGTVYQRFVNGHFEDTDQDMAREICAAKMKQRPERDV